MIQIHRGSCCEYMTGGVNICSNGCVLAPECAVCVCCVWYQIRVPVKNQIMCLSDLSKLDALLHKSEGGVDP